MIINNYDLVWAQEHLTTNITCNYWYDFGAKYILFGEITLDEIKE